MRVALTRLLILLAVAVPASAAPPDEHGLLVYELERIAGGALTELRAESSGHAFLDALSTNETWLRELLDSGPVRNGDVVVRFLFELWQFDPKLVGRPVDRSMATACALAMGMHDRGSEWMRSRYEYFRDAWRDGLLNVCYGDLVTSDRRYLARGAQYASYTAPEALEYLNERICWPRDQYTKACWQAPYRSFNCFNDSVQGWLYYHPFRGSFSCDPEMAIHVGGVCGALSNMGASAAIASGIPALTMGEPGHCAYAVMTEPGVWTPAYSLSWKRGLHTSLHRATWSSLVMSQACLDEHDLVRRAGDKRRLARWYEAHGEADRAEKTLRTACSISPLDEGVWVEYFELGTRQGHDERWWQRARAAIEKSLLPGYPEPAWMLLSTYVLPQIERLGGERDVDVACQSFVRALDGWGPVRWNIEAAWNWMLAKHEPSERRRFFATMLRHVIASTDIGPAFVAWAHGALANDAEALAAFDRELLNKTGRSSAGGDAVLEQLAASALPKAAETHDLETFQRIGRAASRLYEARPPLAESGIEPFPGQLLSSGGALRVFRAGNRWDTPAQHWGVLEERGGWFHTDNGDLPWFEVELPHFGHIEGMILESRAGQLGRSDGVRVLVSDDGESWTQVGELTGRRLWYRLDLSSDRPRAKFIRFERDGQCMHFPRVLIYGKRAS